MKRREFLKASAAAPLLGYFPADLSAIARYNSPGILEKRALGKTGVNLSCLGFGGIVVMDATPEQAAERVSEAIAAGINYFDVAPSYGNAEIRLGPALQPYRKNVFLACKTMARDNSGARKELEQSLINLRTDHFDLYQFHAVTTLEEVDNIFSAGGAMETFQSARKEGKIKFIGFSAHSVEAAMAMMDRFNFDTILFPINYTMWHAGNFGPQVVARASEKQMGILALKAMARGPWPEKHDENYPKCWYEPLSDPQSALNGLRFTLSHPITAALPPGDENLFRLALRQIQNFSPMTETEIKELKTGALTGKPLFRFPMENG